MKTKLNNYFVINNKNILDNVTAIMKNQITNRDRVLIVANPCDIKNNFSTNFNRAIDSKFPQVKENYLMKNKQLGDIQLVTTHKNNNNTLSFANMFCVIGKIGPNTTKTLNYYYFTLAIGKLYAGIKNLKRDTISDIELHIPNVAKNSYGADGRVIKAIVNDVFGKDTMVYIYE